MIIYFSVEQLNYTIFLETCQDDSFLNRFNLQDVVPIPYS